MCNINSCVWIWRTEVVGRVPKEMRLRQYIVACSAVPAVSGKNSTSSVLFLSFDTGARGWIMTVLFYLTTLSQMQTLWCAEWHVDCDKRLSWRALMYCSQGSIAGPWSWCGTSRIDDGEQPAPWLSVVDVLERKLLYLHVERSGPFWKRSQSAVSVTCVQGVRAVGD